MNDTVSNWRDCWLDHFRTGDLYFGRCINPQLHAVSSNTEHRDSDVQIRNEDLLLKFS